jgi:hypothetical protein
MNVVEEITVWWKTVIESTYNKSFFACKMNIILGTICKRQAQEALARFSQT